MKHSTQQPTTVSDQTAPQDQRPEQGQETEAKRFPIKRIMRKYAGVGPERGSGQKAASAPDAYQVNSLGSLEAELMGLLWEIGQPASGMDVMEASLYKRRSAGQEPVSFATVATTLRRLDEKGLLKAERGTLRTPLYTPTVAREQMAARILNNVSITLLGQSLRGLLPRLVGSLPRDMQKSSPEEEDEATRLMQALEEVSVDPQRNLEK